MKDDFIKLPHNRPDRCAERGNALFIIMIAIVLFAALSYTVADMIRSSDPSTITAYKADLYANEILDYARNMRQSVQNLKIANGCGDLEISFTVTGTDGYQHAGPATCKLFEGSGGGMIYARAAEDWLDPSLSSNALYGAWYFPANLCVPGTGTAPAGAGCKSDGEDNEAIIAVLPYVREQVCERINNTLGLGESIPTESSHGWSSSNPKFAGVQADGEILDQSGRMAGCFQGTGSNSPPSGSYHFFQILIPR